MMPRRWTPIGLCVFLAAVLIGISGVIAADDTGRFNGSWKTNFPYNGPHRYPSPDGPWGAFPFLRRQIPDMMPMRWIEGGCLPH